VVIPDEAWFALSTNINS